MLLFKIWARNHFLITRFKSLVEGQLLVSASEEYHKEFMEEKVKCCILAWTVWNVWYIIRVHPCPTLSLCFALKSINASRFTCKCFFNMLIFEDVYVIYGKVLSTQIVENSISLNFQCMVPTCCHTWETRKCTLLQCD